uniref:DH domain-containing protein n=1 Tax=Parascaris equorum TaxID=6256 RepID=A0A914RBT8_PAREQ
MTISFIDVKGEWIIESYQCLILQYDEIDESDGCKVQVYEYHILSADGREELTKICRRKLKIECNQSSRRTEITNGCFARNIRLSSSVSGTWIEYIRIIMQPEILNPYPARKDSDVAIGAVLQKTQEKFVAMLNDQKNQLVSMFPELFSEMRTQSSLIAAPTTEVETIVNPDGSTTTRMRSSRAYSSHFSKQEMYINGVKQESKSKFRAFMEYKGPEGGFKVKLTDNPEGDLSEEEADDASEQNEDTRSQFSEIPENHQIFANISSLHQFHNTHLLPALMESCREWHTTHRISGVLRKRAPFLKMYSEYTNNYKRATKMFDECYKKKRRFAQVVQEIENGVNISRKAGQSHYELAFVRQHFQQSPECENLPLVSHLICPVQRVMRYQLLLQVFWYYVAYMTPYFVLF